uniref:Uncharacterized protein n=1 Tax=Nelumbo nucifera TaxID=4432 RepID=A0A822YHF6_NELNU|nr:TPA_asm: hypothetical protein HUJ06_009752 [Nelumbo nucifera]
MQSQPPLFVSFLNYENYYQMGTEILRPQDCLVERRRVCPVALPRHKPYANNSRSCQRQAIQPEPRKRFPQEEPLISKK